MDTHFKNFIPLTLVWNPSKSPHPKAPLAVCVSDSTCLAVSRQMSIAVPTTTRAIPRKTPQTTFSCVLSHKTHSLLRHTCVSFVRFSHTWHNYCVWEKEKHESRMKCQEAWNAYRACMALCTYCIAMLVQPKLHQNHPGIMTNEMRKFISPCPFQRMLVKARKHERGVSGGLES